MAKHKYGFDEAKIARFLKEGRGLGHGKEYQPWLTIQDVPSSGLVSRLTGRKTQRTHHLLSKNELGIFCLLEWSDAVVDIREGFPLDREITRQIAAEMGVEHPKDPKTHTDIVMTTDFVVDMQYGESIVEKARSVKPRDSLQEPRVIVKQEIERRYWAIKDGDWGILVDTDIPKQRVANLAWLFEFQTFEHQVTPYAGFWEDKCQRFEAAMAKTPSTKIDALTQLLETSYGFKKGETLSVFRHLGAQKRILFDLDQDVDIRTTIIHSTNYQTNQNVVRLA